MAAEWWSELLAGVGDILESMVSEFSDEWRKNDLRGSILCLLLAWLLLSVIAIHLTWRIYGPSVTAFYCRQVSEPGGQNGGTPEYSSHFPIWESSSTESLKSHQE